MLILGADYLTSLLAEGSFSAKMVFNARGAIVFPVSREHRDQKAPGISYEDDYKGNALVAMLAPGKIEIRGHQGFSDSQVAEIVSMLLTLPELALLKDWTVVYRGRKVVRCGKNWPQSQANLDLLSLHFRRRIDLWTLTDWFKTVS